MQKHAAIRVLSMLGAACIAAGDAAGLEVQNYAVLVTAKVSRGPATIELNWLSDPKALSYVLSRRLPGQTAWQATATLPGSATQFIDRKVLIGQPYEYLIEKEILNSGEGAVTYTGYGLIQAGIALRPVAKRGQVILLVDDTVAGALDLELARLRQDLVGDGWSVLRHDVARSATPPEIKAIIKADYDADPARVRAVFLFGHVPVPYSGDNNPDAHSDHRGAWPADVFYGDMDGIYTDETVNRVTAARTENRNVPGDGKYDNTLIPSAAGQTCVELQVGRVDFVEMPAFGQSEIELLRRYLEKNHSFRHKLISVELRGLIDDQLGTANGEAFATDGWRNFAPLLSSQNVITGSWIAQTEAQSWLWAYGCGLANYSAISGVVSTADFATKELRAVFVLLFGSYFGDWDSPDNLLRAPLAGTGCSLASVWTGRPHWHFYPMALGETVGYCARLTQNENLLGPYNIGANETHVALMGDPTLRMHQVAPVANFHVRKSGVKTSLLRWKPSAEAVVGYHVYVAATPDGPFRRITVLPFKGTRLSVRNHTRPRTFMVRAVKLESTPSGSYFNQSQGVMVTLSP